MKFGDQIPVVDINNLQRVPNLNDIKYSNYKIKEIKHKDIIALEKRVAELENRIKFIENNILFD